MPYVLKNTFTRGEISRKALGRVDTEAYVAGAETLRNFLVLPQGGLRRRSGTQFAGRTKTKTDRSRLIPFVFSAGDSYVLEFGDQYVRFWTIGGQVVDAGSPVEIATPYTLAQINRVQYVQSGAALYLVHPDHPPQRLVRNSAISWSIDPVEFFDGPFDDLNDSDTTVSTLGSSLPLGQTRDLQFSSTENINGGAGFDSGDVGRHIRVRTNEWAWCVITAIVSTTRVTVEIRRLGLGESDSTSAGSSGSIRSWRLGMFGDNPGWPGSIALFEGRLVYARTETRPTSVMFSRPGLPDDFGPSAADSTVTEDAGFVRTILQGRADEILWLHETPGVLLVGTAGGIRSISSPDNSENFGPANARQRLAIQFGSDSSVPINAGSNTLMAGRYGKSIRDIFFDFNVNRLVAPNISLLSDHLLKGGLAEMQFAQEPDSVVWAHNDDGTVFGLTYDKSEQIVGFHPHDVTGNVESLSVIPGPDRDVVWMQVERIIDGQTARYIEFFQSNFDEEVGNQEDAFFVDSGLTYDGPPTNQILGLSHLEGQEVAILGNGAVLPRQTVTGGAITLANNFEVTLAHVGLPMTSTVELLRPPINQRDGPTIGRRQRVVAAVVEVLNTLGLKVGSRFTTTLEPLDHRRPSDLMGNAPNLKNGIFKKPVRDRQEDGGRLKLEITDPLPAYIRLVNQLVEGEDV